MRPRHTARIVAVLLGGAATLAGCAQTPPPQSAIAPDIQTTAVPSAGPGEALGTIVSRRSLPVTAWRTGVLTALHSSTAAGTPEGAEYIVAAAGGLTLSVVQPEQAVLQPGTRVRIMFSSHTRIVRAE